jgi:hypothetical protein
MRCCKAHCGYDPSAAWMTRVDEEFAAIRAYAMTKRWNRTSFTRSRTNSGTIAASSSAVRIPVGKTAIALRLTARALMSNKVSTRAAGLSGLQAGYND